MVLHDWYYAFIGEFYDFVDQKRDDFIYVVVDAAYKFRLWGCEDSRVALHLRSFPTLNVAYKQQT